MLWMLRAGTESSLGTAVTLEGKTVHDGDEIVQSFCFVHTSLSRLGYLEQCLCFVGC